MSQLENSTPFINSSYPDTGFSEASYRRGDTPSDLVIGTDSEQIFRPGSSNSAQRLRIQKNFIDINEKVGSSSTVHSNLTFK